MVTVERQWEVVCDRLNGATSSDLERHLKVTLIDIDRDIAGH